MSIQRIVCPDCNGNGVVIWPKPVMRPGEDNTVEVQCPKCKGRGTIDPSEHCTVEAKT